MFVLQTIAGGAKAEPPVLFLSPAALLNKKASGAVTQVASMLHPALLGQLGIAIALAGGVLACRADLKNRPALQRTAGLLLITGFACLGVAISLVVGSP